MGAPVAGHAGKLRPRGRLADLLAAPPGWAILAVCGIVLCLRRAGAVTNPQFWAEDGYFFERAYSIGWHALLLPYAGYLHTAPRIIGAVAVATDPANGPGIFVAFSAALTLYVAGRTLSARCPLPRAAGACALAVVLVPDTYEVFLNVVNLQWVLGAGLVLLLVSEDPTTGCEWVHDLVAAALMGLTGPFCVVLLPLFAWRAWERRTRASAVMAMLNAVCASIQAGCMVAAPAATAGIAGERMGFGLLLPAVGRRVGESLLLGSLTPASTGPVAGTLVGMATLVAVGWLAFRKGRLSRERSMLGLAFLGILASGLYRTRHGLDGYFQPVSHARYVFIPQLTAVWLLLSAAAQGDFVGRIATYVCLIGVLTNIPRYRAPAYDDLHWSKYEPSIRAGEPVVVPINPPGWTMPLPARNR
jgi:hypothetical protein